MVQCNEAQSSNALMSGCKHLHLRGFALATAFLLHMSALYDAIMSALSIAFSSMRLCVVVFTSLSALLNGLSALIKCSVYFCDFVRPLSR